MILQEKEIRDLISKNYSKQVKQNSTGNIYNQYEYDERECLDLIETYIFEKKGQKVGDIQSPSLALKQMGSFEGLVAQQRYKRMEECFDIAIRYYNEKFNRVDD
jgi:hypothetical protein